MAEPVDLDAVAQLLTGLPRGPWHVEYFGDEGYPQRVCNDAAIVVADTHQGGTGLRPTPEFIAAARTLVPRMADEIAALRAEVARLRAGEADDPGHENTEPTPAQWIRRWNDLPPERRLQVAAAREQNARTAYDCFLRNHEGQIAELRGRVEELQQPVRDAALAALDTMRAGHHAATDRALNQLRAQHGMAGITTALMHWCDAALDRMPIQDGPVRLSWVDTETGRIQDTDAGVPITERWACRLLTARANDDRDMFLDLIKAVPDEAIGAHVGAMVQMAACIIQEAA
ncbi:hypothetical protein [Actinomadura bangladeshensis]|uniref:Uncharacterized protein n=1 Tax=Actinomadura bangladeshensis TaxID=453573 RepID=A0A6L9QCZ8_9ACTN|nr:hypothetical protein [Actinomadura bangladeshensis]NEA21593.1 hypothetical protein [Actinomadura bangladeshensis]NEA22553.1 hypothetical protein [Actinomadura bangladeshensis]